jgi:hypothetical protein
VQAASSDGSVATETFTIAVEDVDEFDVSVPVDLIDPAGGSVAENSAIGTAVGITALASDGDATNSGVTYSLTGNPGGLFQIDPVTGVVTTAAAIDREVVGPSVDIEVTATSQDGSTQAQTFTIAIEDVVENDALSDFDGDGTSDILWRNVDGTLTNWLMDGGQYTGAGFGYSIPTDWSVVGTGDFDGDSTDDILWRNDDGTLTNWLMDGGQYTGAGFGYSMPTDWIVQG